MMVLDKTVYLTSEEIRVIVDALDLDFQEHNYGSMLSDESGKYYDESYPFDAKRANLIQELVNRLS